MQIVMERRICSLLDRTHDSATRATYAPRLEQVSDNRGGELGFVREVCEARVRYPESLMSQACSHALRNRISLSLGVGVPYEGRTESRFTELRFGFD